MGLTETDQKALSAGVLSPQVSNNEVLEALPEVDWSPAEERKAKRK